MNDAAVESLNWGAVRHNKTYNFHFLGTKIAITFTICTAVTIEIQGLKVLGNAPNQ